VCLTRFDWPGNVRELQNEIERAVALARDGDIINVTHLSRKLEGARAATEAAATVAAHEPGSDATPDSTAAARTGETLQEVRAAFEARYIARLLGEHGGNVSRTAQALGLSRVALHRKMKEYGLR
jgi:DNA-binding NtrC family response regulator